MAEEDWDRADRGKDHRAEQSGDGEEALADRRDDGPDGVAAAVVVIDHPAAETEHDAGDEPDDEAEPNKVGAEALGAVEVAPRDDEKRAPPAPDAKPKTLRDRAVRRRAI